MALRLRIPVGIDAGQRYYCHSLDETRELAVAFAGMLQAGDVVLLRGEIGAGKTAFVKLAARALGYSGIVSSPTFTLLNIYEAPQVAIYHFDFYRLRSDLEAEGIGAQDYIDGDGIVFIEWPEKVTALLPDTYYDIHFHIPDFSGAPGDRELTFKKVEKQHVGIGP